MKRIRREIFGNIALTVGLVGVVCFVLAAFGKTEMSQSGIVTYRTSHAPAATQSLGGDRSWLVPNIAQSDFHASSTRRSVRTATTPAATGQSIVGTGLQGGTSVSSGATSGGIATTHRSAATTGSSVARASGSVSGCASSSVASQSVRTVIVSEPFADELERPSARPRPKVGGDGGKDEPFPEEQPPLGGALVPLLLCASAYVVWLHRKKRCKRFFI